MNDKYVELISEITKLDYHYYTLDEPLVSDKEYDKLYQQLVDLETEHPEIKLPSSPTNRVGGDVLSKFEKKEHTVPLYSLGKSQNYEGVQKFINDTCKETGEKLVYSIEQKMDGLAFVAVYKDGFLVEGRTRGTGKIGEVITEQLKTIRTLPLEVNITNHFEVQGEVFMPLSKFEEYNANLPKEEVPLKNARNGAAGALRNLDPKITAGRPIDAFVYNVPYSDGFEFNTQESMMAFLHEQGFHINPYFYTTNKYEEIIQKLDEMVEIRPTLDWDIDGMVIKVNDITKREGLGYTAKYPKWAIAFKFEAIEETTTLTNVQWQVGRTGKLTPLAILDPVDIGGATVTKATLNNYDDILRKKVKLGAEVFVRRSNDVIPEIMGIVEGSIGADIQKPTSCPICSTEVEHDGVHLYCPNTMGCSAQAINKFIHYASREAMNIETLNEKTIEQLADADLIHNSFVDLYGLQKEDLLKLERFGNKKADNLLNAIEASKERPLEAFLYALGIRLSGKGTAERLLRYYDNIDQIANASVEDLMKIEDIGPYVAQSIFDYFNDDNNLAMIEQLKNIGINMTHERQEQAGNSLDGLTFVLTGKISAPRKEVEALIKQHGGKTSSSVSAKTSYLVAGEAAGSKLTKAESIGVKIITEEELYSMM